MGTSNALAPVSGSDPARLEQALIKAIGFDRLAPEQRELALAIASRYELDPMLKHIVMVEGRPYITRDGLLHVAHRSGVFDGIEVVEGPTLVGDYWTAKVAVYRKDFSRPFVYPGRYPAKGKNVAYAPEMAIKVSEVMTLRRAFDVAAPVVEERWAGDVEDDAPEHKPSSVASALDAKIAQIAAPAPVAVVETRTDADPVAVVVETVVEAPAPAPGLAPEAFVEWAKTVDRDVLREVATHIFAPGRRFADLDAGERLLLRDSVEAFVAAKSLAPSDDAGDPEPAGLPAAEPSHPQEPAPSSVEPVSPKRARRPEPVVETESESDLLAQAMPESESASRSVVFCGDQSPFSDATCTMDKGHTGSHRRGLRETW